MNPRTEALRRHSLDARPSISAERALLLTRFYRENDGRWSVPVTRARSFLDLCEKKTIHLGKGELIVTYHFYEARKKGLDERMGQDLAPKIQALYRKFPGLHRITFKIEVYEQRDVVLWRPYCSFVTTRKIIDDTDWTSLLLKDFFGIVQELAYAE